MCELLASGAKIYEMDKVSHLLLTLPSSYNGVITAIETLAKENLTLAFLKNRLLDHEIKIKNDSSDTRRKVMKSAVYNNNNYKNRSFKSSNSGIRKPFKEEGKFITRMLQKIKFLSSDCRRPV